jgi:hypothetical protein
LTNLKNFKLWQKGVYGVILSILILVIIGIVFGIIVFYDVPNQENSFLFTIGLFVIIFGGGYGGNYLIIKLLKWCWKID